MSYSLSQALYLSLLVAACQTKARPAESSGEARAVEVSLIERSGLFTAEPSYTYSLLGCGDGGHEPSSPKAGLYVFKVRGLSNGDRCRLEIYDPARLAQGAKYQWQIKGKDGLVYFADVVDISRGAFGQLEGTAILTRAFQEAVNRDTSFALKIPIRTPADFKPDDFAAQLSCAPTLSDSIRTVTVRGNDLNYELLIALKRFTPGSTISCSRLSGGNGSRAWVADFSPPATFSVPTSATEIALIATPVELRRQGVSEIEVEVKSAQCQEAGEAFNPMSRACEAAVTP